MKDLYMVTEFECNTYKKGSYEDGKWYVVIDGHKVYVSQFDDLMLFENEVVVITEDEEKISYYRDEIRDFYDKYPRKREWLWHTNS